MRVALARRKAGGLCYKEDVGEGGYGYCVAGGGEGGESGGERADFRHGGEREKY